MIRYKEGVNPNLIHDELVRYWIPMLYTCWHDKFHERDMVITSGYRDDGSSHSDMPSRAIDLRRYVEYGPHRYVDFCRTVQKYYGEWLGVQLEPEWGKGAGYTGEHIHIQLKGETK